MSSPSRGDSTPRLLGYRCLGVLGFTVGFRDLGVQGFRGVGFSGLEVKCLWVRIEGL